MLNQKNGGNKMKKQSEAAQVAKAIKQLAKKYNVELSYCRSKNYSGGNSVSVYYRRGQDQEAVKKLKEAAAVYKAGYFNAMDDIYEYKSVSNGLPKADYVFFQEEWR